jgi:precorrin-2 dehydrogenase/sirohydrochlorin ferrochelatase
MMNLSGKHCLVVGGGRVAERRAASLWEAGAVVTIIAPEATGRLQALQADGSIRWLARPYCKGDVREDGGFVLVMAATDNSEVNELVREDALQAGVLYNAADDPTGGDFIVPAVLRRGSLTIAVTTGGDSPALAARIRHELEETYGAEYEAYIEFLGEARRRLRERLDDTELRQALLRHIAEWDLIPLIRTDAARWPAVRDNLLSGIDGVETQREHT